MRSPERLKKDGAEVRQSESLLQKMFGFGQRLLPFIAILGVLAYGILRIIYENFYTTLGVSLEQVGLNRTALLEQALVGFAIFVTAVVLIYMIYMICSVPFLIFSLRAVKALIFSFRAVKPLLWRAAVPNTPRTQRRNRLRQPRFRAQTKSEDGRASTALKYVILATLFLSIPISVSILYYRAGKLANDTITTGRAIAPEDLRFFPTGKIGILKIQAVPVSIAMYDEGKAIPSPLKDSSCLLYLGSAAGRATFYDVRGRRVVTVSEGNLVITADTSSAAVAEQCSPKR